MTIDYQAPIAPERALRYLLKEGYGDLSKILAVARAASGYLYAGLSEKELEQLLQTIYDEDYHTAYNVGMRDRTATRNYTFRPVLRQ
jgi:hypothetical protein